MSDDLANQGRSVARDLNNGFPMTCARANIIEQMADRIEELEVKLAKALDFIEDLTGCEWPYDERAKRIFAEITGGEDE